MSVLPEAVAAAARDQLPPLTACQSPSGDLDRLCRFYGIDFEHRLNGVSHVAGLVRSGDYQLAVHVFCREGAVANLLLLHGYTDHCGLFKHLIEFGLAQNCNVVIFDLPGHGLSSGEVAAIDHFSQYSLAINDVLRAVDVPALPWWCMAQSTGCAALMDYARRYTWHFAATVLLAPLIRPARWHAVLLAYRCLRPFVESVKRGYSDNSGDAEFLASVRTDPLQPKRLSLRWIGALRHWLAHLSITDLGVGPALVVQGDADATVDWRYNLPRVQQLFPASTVHNLAGAGHQLANETELLRQDYLARVQAYLLSQVFAAGAAG